MVSDYVGVVSGRDEDKFTTTNLRLAPSSKIMTPLLADCPVNIEYTVEHTIELDSHTMFIGLVQAVHVDESLLDERGEVDLVRAHGLIDQAGVVRERPTYNFRVSDL